MSRERKDTFEPLLNASRIGVLDGGFATHLEDVYQIHLPSPLWSATLLDPNYPLPLAQSPDLAANRVRDGVETGHGAICATHRAFADAGARLIEAASYQASLPSFRKRVSKRYSDEESQRLMRSSVTLLDNAVAKYSPKPLLALSLGPYGAMLEGGREYSGDYASSNGTAVKEAMRTFHRDRLQTFATEQEEEHQWSKVDLLALETIPRIDEAQCVLDTLQELRQQLAVVDQQGNAGDGHVPPAYLAFTFPEPESTSTEGFVEHGLVQPKTESADFPRDLTRLVEVLCFEDIGVQGKAYPLLGFGVNCTKPHLIAGLVEQLTATLVKCKEKVPEGKQQRIFQTASGDPALFIYPDGGMVWDGIARQWSLTSHSSSAGGDAEAWAAALVDVAEKGMSDEDRPWDCVWIGGCCKASVRHIAALTRRVYDT